MFLFGNTRWLPPLRVQWVLGAMVAMLPLLAGMFYAIKTMDEYNRTQSRLVALSAHLAASGASISDQAKDLERVFRQYQLLKNERFRVVFGQKQAELSAQLTRVSAALPLNSPTDKLQQLKSLLGQLGEKIDEANDQEALATDFRQLHSDIKSLNNQTASILKSQVVALNKRYEESQWRLMVMGAWVLPGTLILVWLVSVMVLRPIFQLSEAIKRLGNGDWQTDIKISGSNEMALLGENLTAMKTQLQSIESQKQTFLQQVTHELKTPLAAIMEAGSLLEDEVPGRLNKSQRQVLAISQNNAANLQTLIQQLLDYNSAVKDNFQELQSMELESFFKEKLSDFIGIAETRNVNLILQGHPIRVLIDVVRTSMIIRNIVSNAVQLTPDGKNVVVTWGIADDHWFLSVTDQGPGISELELDRIFEPFYQGSAQKQGSLKGSGIGLSIVKECADFVGASITLKEGTAEGGETGACFVVKFPLLEEDEASSNQLALNLGVSA